MRQELALSAFMNQDPILGEQLAVLNLPTLVIHGRCLLFQHEICASA